jgi:hypothetical protein
VGDRFPWGPAGPAPALRCDECGKRIGKPRTHFVTASQNLLCARCMVPSASGTRCLHAEYYPDCPVRSHDMFDHHVSYATPAAAWVVLADPGKRVAGPWQGASSAPHRPHAAGQRKPKGALGRPSADPRRVRGRDSCAPRTTNPVTMNTKENHQ